MDPSHRKNKKTLDSNGHGPSHWPIYTNDTV